jgi:guanine nucleotide-binding protein subunit alpha
MARSLDEDPLTLAIAPPPDETYEQRQIREAAEAEAKRISDEIDEQIRRDREAERRKKKPVKLLLLGAFSLCFSELALMYIIKARAKAGKRRH